MTCPLSLQTRPSMVVMGEGREGGGAEKVSGTSDEG